jgi:hypothetical protein
MTVHSIDKRQQLQSVRGARRGGTGLPKVHHKSDSFFWTIHINLLDLLFCFGFAKVRKAAKFAVQTHPATSRERTSQCRREISSRDASGNGNHQGFGHWFLFRSWGRLHRDQGSNSLVSNSGCHSPRFATQKPCPRSLWPRRKIWY